MLVRNWMTPDVLTVSPDTSLLKIGKMMRDNNVRRLPVVDAKGQVVGIISDRDVRDASPSKARPLTCTKCITSLPKSRPGTS